jgi:hypothetical protein
LAHKQTTFISSPISSICFPMSTTRRRWNERKRKLFPPILLLLLALLLVYSLFSFSFVMTIPVEVCAAGCLDISSLAVERIINSHVSTKSIITAAVTPVKTACAQMNKKIFQFHFFFGWNNS